MLPNASEADEYHQRGYDLHRSGQIQEAAAHYREAVRLQPDHVMAWGNLGLTHTALGEFGEAERCQREALLLRPDFADAHNNLGLVHYQLGRVAEAENCFRASLRLRPGHPNALLNLAIAEHSLGRLDAAEIGYREALATGADPVGTNSNLSVLLRETRRVAEAESHARAALAISPAFPAAHINLALALLLSGRWTEAWPHYEARWLTGDLEDDRREFRQPQWTGEQPIEGRTLLLHAEQGLGDTLQFCRYAPLVAARGAHVVLELQPQLVRLLSRLPGIESVVTKGDPLPPFDLHCPLMSLPMAFGTTPETIPTPYPYLAAEHAAMSMWRQRLASLPGCRVGLVWAGSSRTWLPHAAAIDRRRSMRLAHMAPLADIPGCSFVSLQLGRPAAQLASPPRGLVVHEFADDLHDFAETAALVANLDLVISVDTAVAHLAAALGRPVWLLNRFDTCWRWLLDRDDSPWYLSLRQFRQASSGDWLDVMCRTRDALEAFVQR
jgi:Flp pilus assembly protein TadD